MSTPPQPNPTPGPEIANCPFCDQAAEVVDHSHKLGARQGPSVRCANPSCVAWNTNLCDGIFTNAPDAIAAWNQLAKKLREK